MADFVKIEYAEVESMMNTSLNQELADDEMGANGFNASFADDTGKFISGNSFGQLASSQLVMERKSTLVELSEDKFATGPFRDRLQSVRTKKNMNLEELIECISESPDTPPASQLASGKQSLVSPNAVYQQSKDKIDEFSLHQSEQHSTNTSKRSVRKNDKYERLEHSHVVLKQSIYASFCLITVILLVILCFLMFYGMVFGLKEAPKPESDSTSQDLKDL